jgi:hypothetical protein
MPLSPCPTPPLENKKTLGDTPQWWMIPAISDRGPVQENRTTNSPPPREGGSVSKVERSCIFVPLPDDRFVAVIRNLRVPKSPIH